MISKELRKLALDKFREQQDAICCAYTRAAKESRHDVSPIFDWLNTLIPKGCVKLYWAQSPNPSFRLYIMELLADGNDEEARHLLNLNCHMHHDLSCNILRATHD